MSRPVNPWWEEPRLSYGRGLLDGYRLGHDEAIADILDRVFAGELLREASRVVTTQEPIPVHPTTPDQLRSWPRLAYNWPGTDHMTPAQRRSAWRRLINSWEID